MAPALADKQHRSPYSPALGLRFLLLAGLSILLLVIDHRYNHLDTARKAIGATVYPASGDCRCACVAMALAR